MDGRNDYLNELAKCKCDRDELAEALKYHQEQTRPIQRTVEILAKVGKEMTK